MYTIVQLSCGATVEQACQLANVATSDVNLVQRIGEVLPETGDDFRIIIFDGEWIKICQRVGHAQRLVAFPVPTGPCAA